MATKRLSLIIPFAFSILALFAFSRVSGWLNHDSVHGGFGFHLRESAHSLGIDFVHEISRLDPKIKNTAPMIVRLAGGASVAVCDFNNDGWPDLYVANSQFGTKNRLYINHEGKRFEDVAEKAGVADLNLPDKGVSTGAACADYDNDGNEDLLVHRWGHLELFRNNGDGTFTNVTSRAGLDKDWIYASGATWWDFNRDGCLDLYVGAYYRPEYNLWNLNTTRIYTDDFERARNGGRNKLYEQVKDNGRCTGTFQEASQKYGIDDPGWTLAVGAADLDGNGFPDLYVANDFGPDSLFLNLDGSHFKKLVERHGIGDDTKKGMNVAFGDFNNSGRLSIYVTNITEPGFLVEGNMLWENLGNGKFRDVAWNVGAAECGWAWGAVFGDLNNDGHVDIYAVNGMVSGAPNTEYWYDLFTMSVGINLIIEDLGTWPPMGDKSFSGHQRPCVFLNSGDGVFRDVASKAGVNERFDGRGVALADLDRNGTLDVIVANQNGPLLVYLNSVEPERKWIQFRLKGTKSNRSAIGTQVTLYWNNQKQVQVLDGGGGYTGHSEKLLHFGLGKDPKLDRAEIRWPSGKVQTLRDLEPNKLHVVEEP
jgi:enediyne biosynthesis protein E4